jgi:hypothetical protein
MPIAMSTNPLPFSMARGGGTASGEIGVIGVGMACPPD